MTCIIGYFTNTCDIYMGGDSIGVSDGDWMILKTPKIFIKDGMIFGTSSSLRIGQILRYSFDVPEHPDGMDTTHYICNIFMAQLIETFKKTDFKKDNKDDEERWDLLLGYKGKLFTVQDNFQIVEDVKSYTAIGCGRDYAKGALHILEENKSLSAEKRILTALDAASQFSMVKPPYYVLKL